ncbi:MAG: glycosyltransferase [Deltaproteobacteria bacterium]|nr:glycosyltransferase [Deltaproteobacteria bacterium]
MNLVYNALDVLLELSVEGFGLRILESESAGCPVVTLNHGAGPEINFLGLNCRVAAKHYTIRGSWWGIPDPEHACELIERAISFNRARIARQLHEKAKAYDWPKIAQQALKLLEEASVEFMPQRVVSR